MEKTIKTKLQLYPDALIILLFHGIVERSNYSVRNYIRKHIEREYFYTLLKDLKAKGRCLSMDEVVSHHVEKKPFPPYSFAITFDDGFENNYSLACPVLTDLSLPAIFYVTSNFIEKNHMSWTDRLELCLERKDKGTLMFPWSKEPASFNSASDKIRIMSDIRSHVKRDRSIETDSFVREVFNQCELEEVFSSDDPIDKKMSWQQVQELNNSDLFTVGGHGHTHRILSFLTEQELRSEIDTSFELLKQRAEINTVHYSYPDGLKHCYNDSVIRILKDRGIVCAPSAEEGKNTLKDDLFHLKRVMVV